VEATKTSWGKVPSVLKPPRDFSISSSTPVSVILLAFGDVIGLNTIFSRLF